MEPYKIVAKKVDDIGITIAELARRTKIDAELLRRSLNGQRVLKAGELISLCVQLNLEVDDFVTRKAS